MKFFILIIAILASVNIFSQNQIKGKIISEKGDTLASATIAILNNDSAIVTGSITDINGNFNIPNILPDNYIIRLSIVGYTTKFINLNVTDNIDMGTIILTEDQNMLAEVEVLSNLRQTFTDRDELLLPQTVKLNSQNAVDAISQMPKFLKNMNGQLATIDGGNLLIIINGRKATNEELTAIHPDNIKKLIHYTSPPARYAGNEAQSVLEVITKHQTNQTFDLVLNTQNSLLSANGNNNINAIYADSVNKVSAFYGIDYQHFKHGHSENIYRYSDNGIWSENRYSSTSASAKHITQTAMLDYSLTKEKYLFAVKAQYSHSPTNNTTPQNITLTSQNNEITTGNGINKLNNKQQIAAIDLYLGLQLKNKQELLFNVVNTYSIADAHNYIIREITAKPAQNYSIQNKYHNNSYSLIAQITYITPLWGGELEASAYFIHKQLRQLYNNSDITKLNYQTETAHLMWKRQWGKWGLLAALQARNLTFNGPRHYNFFNFTPNAIANYNPSDLVSLKLHVGGATNMLETGDMAGSTITIDERYISVGNPTLKPLYGFQTIFSIDIKNKKNTFFFSPYIKYWYAKDFHAAMLYAGDDGLFYKQTHNTVNPVTLQMYATIQWQPIKWLTLIGQFFACYNEFTSISNGLKHNWWSNQKVGIRFNIWEMQAEFLCTNPLGNILNDYNNGDYIIHTPPSYRAAITWTHKFLKIGLAYSHQPGSTTLASIPTMTLTESTTWLEHKHFLTLDFAYHFNHGKAKTRNREKKLYNEDTDTGLTPDMKAK